MDYKLEVVVVPVSDVDRAKQFYSEKAGFVVDVDIQPSEKFRVVQLTPPGSGCSIAIGTGLAQMEPGSLKGLQLSVAFVREGDALVSRSIHDCGFMRLRGPHSGPDAIVAVDGWRAADQWTNAKN